MLENIVLAWIDKAAGHASSLENGNVGFGVSLKGEGRSAAFRCLRMDENRCPRSDMREPRKSLISF